MFPARCLHAGLVMHPIIRQNAIALVLPDLRNLGTILRIVLAVNAMTAVAALAREPHFDLWTVQWLDMTAVVEPQGEHRVARLEQPVVDGHVRLRPGMRLHVRVLRAEECLRAVDRELLDLVDELAATVVAAPRISLRVLVRQDGADGFEHRRPREVLRRDQLDLAALTIGLPADQRSDLGIVLREPPDPQTLEVVGGDCHGTMLLAAAARQPELLDAALAADRRLKTGLDASPDATLYRLITRAASRRGK